MSSLRALEENPNACCARCTALTRYVRQIANLMWLRDWAVEVAHDPPADASSVATVELAAERKLLRVRFAVDFEHLPATEQRHAVVHELVHPITRDLYETVRGAAVDEIGGAAGRVFLAHVKREFERATDVLASVIAPYLPEPD